jgi:hypothetical protein
MRESEIFTPGEMKLFREVDRETALEREADAVARIEPRETTTPIVSHHDLNAKHSADWDRFVQAHIQKQWDNVYSPAVSEAMSEYVTKRLSSLMKALGAEAGEIEKRLRSELTALREQVAALQLEAAYQRGASDRARGAEVIDLPAILPSKRNKLNG